MNASEIKLQHLLAREASLAINGVRSWEKNHYQMAITYLEEDGLAFIEVLLPLETRVITAHSCIVSLN